MTMSAQPKCTICKGTGRIFKDILCGVTEECTVCKPAPAATSETELITYEATHEHMQKYQDFLKQYSQPLPPPPTLPPGSGPVKCRCDVPLIKCSKSGVYCTVCGEPA